MGMKTAERPKRWWYRLHLSTAIMLMLVAAGWIWLSFVPERNEREPIEGSEQWIAENGMELGAFFTQTEHTDHYGFPLSSVWVAETVVDHSRFGVSRSTDWGITGISLVLNIVALACVLLVAFLLSEWFISLRERGPIAGWDLEEEEGREDGESEESVDDTRLHLARQRERGALS